MLVRKATLADAEALRTLMEASVASLSEGFYDPDQTERAKRFITVPDENLLRDGTMYVVADGERLAACGAWSARKKLYTGSNPDPGSDELLLNPAVEPARIRAFFVHPGYARQGLGRRLFEACVADARSAGFSCLELMATLPGVPLYERLGFERLEETDIPLPDGTTLPGVKMRMAI